MAVKRGLGRGLGGGIDSIISPNAVPRRENTTARSRTKEETKDSFQKTAEEAVYDHAEEADGSKVSVRVNSREKNKSQVTSDHVKDSEQKQTAKAVGAPVSQGGEVLLSILDVEPNREQPRKVFDEEALEELAASIKQYGILSPILVQKNGDYYEIIAGERRWRAAKMAGLKEIPVIIREYTKQEVVEISLIENIQREDLNPIEEARAYKRLLTEFDLTQETVAARVSKSRAAITNSTRLLKLDTRVQDMLIEGAITAGHARALLSVPDAKLQYALAQRIARESLSVREVEKLVRQTDTLQEAARQTKKEDPLGFLYRDMEERMTGALGTKVAIRRGRGNKGKIEISYHSDEELERLSEVFLSASL